MAAAPGENGFHDGAGDVLGLKHEVAEGRVCDESTDQGRTNPCGVHEAVDLLSIFRRQFRPTMAHMYVVLW